MKKLFPGLCAFLLLLALTLSRAHAGDLRTIDGQVFIRTRGGETIKLSLVDVLLFDEKVVSEHLAKRRREAAPLEEYLTPVVEAAREASRNAKKASEEAAKAEHAAFEAMLKQSNSNSEGLKAAGEKTNAARERSWSADSVAKRMGAKIDFLHSSPFFLADLPQPLQVTKTDADGRFNLKVPSGVYALVARSGRKAGESFEYYSWIVKITVSANTNVMLANDNLSDSGSEDSMIFCTADGGGRYSGDITVASLIAFIEQDKRERAEAEAAKAAKLELARQAEMESYRKDPKAAQRKAIELYPQIGVAGSPLNAEFVARMKRYQAEKKDFFAEPDWPVRLAKECSEAVAGVPPTKLPSPP